ncbi:MAG: ABC transporter ATP-binding protein [Desulfocapsaceae bacterium]|jgi:iron complex transport system ATP-binding protein|nr:ABC transporter ATP-binding protein [Desulfocapsaceae bacterium]
MNSDTPAYSVEQLSFSYGPIRCLSDITIEIGSGRFYGLIGPNGSGKSTLIDLLSAHLFADEGTIQVGNENIRSYSRRQLARRLTSVPQSFSLNFDYRVEDVVMMGRYPYIPRFSKPQKSDCDAVENALQSLDIEHLRTRKVTQLSGGEKQRVMIARSLAQESDIILLDEVTSNLDINHAVSIMKVMLKMVETHKKTVIAALHDLNIASTFCDELIVLRDGYLVESGETSKVLSEHLIEDLYHIKSTISTDLSTSRKHIKYQLL